MVKSSIEAKVRPLANPSLEKASLLGAARIYISKEAMLALTNGLDHGRPCVIDRLEPSPALPRRHAALWLLPDKNVGANVVMMTRAYQEAAGFRIGDQVRIALAGDAVPDAVEVAAVDVSGEGQQGQQQMEQQPVSRHAPGWEFSLALSMDRAEQIFPGMVFEGVNINKLRRSFKVLSVDSQTTNLAKFQLASTTVRIIQPGESKAGSDTHDPDSAAGQLLVSGVPGLTSQIDTLNRFLGAFGRPFWLPGERESCALVIHGGRGTGKTMILRRLEDTRWGKAYWVRPSDKLSTVRDTFRQARALQPSMVLVDGLEDLLSRERANRETVIEALADELDGLAEEAARAGALPRVVVVVTCLDYMTDVPTKLQKRSRLRANIALPIPRAPERLEILRYLDPPLRPEDRDGCLASIAGKTHAFNGDDLANLVLEAKRILGDRLDREAAALSSSISAPSTLSLPLEKLSIFDGEQQQQQQQQQQQPRKQHHLHPDDLDSALRVTRPSAMHDINLKPPTIHWQDVGGQDNLKRVLARMIKNAKDTNPASRHVLRHPPKGLLLYGPPGCSKTLSAQAMATESAFNFFAVKGAELLNMYVGESERAVRNLFDRARAATPAIIFFDEIDSIGGQRGGGSTSGGGGGGAGASGSGSARAGSSAAAVNMLTTLLTEMDGFEALSGVLVLAATNRPEAMDPALLRPGRFDQVLYVGPPDQSAREAILSVHLRGLSLAPDVDVVRLARLAEGCTGAEIKAACNEAGLAVLDRYDEWEPPDGNRGDDHGGGGGCEGGEGGGGESGDVSRPRLQITMDDLVAAVERTPRNVTQGMLDGYDAWRRQFGRVT